MEKTTLTDRTAEILIDVLQKRKEPNSFLQKFKWWSRLVLLLISFAYLGVAGALAIVLPAVGERTTATALLLYVPPQLWLLPALALVPLSLLIRPRYSLLSLGAISLILLQVMGFHWSSSVTPQGRTLTVVSNNRGESNGQSLTPFIRAEDPDFLVLQDDGRAYAFRREYPDRFAESHGEFTLVSKYPILRSGFVDALASPKPIAAWFEVDVSGQTMVIYNVHFPTPRQDLLKARSRVLFSTLFWHQDPVLQALEQRWDSRLDFAERFASLLAQEKRPCIAAGDFNAPQCGYIYRTITRVVQDSFAEKGRGFGFSFPGATRNPLSLFGPWLRIDYIFANQSLRPVYARTESHRKSQHRGVVARFEMTPQQAE